MTGSASVMGCVQMALPGDDVRLSIALKQPIVTNDCDHFAIREGGKTVRSSMDTRING